MSVFRSRKIPYGFTLVELMITVSILAILAAVAIPMYSNYVNRAKQADAIIGLKAVQMAQEQFYSENNAYCNTVDLLPGFNDGSVDNVYVKGEYTFKVTSVTSTPTFTAAATWVDSSKGINDKWIISNTNIEPVASTASGVTGVKGYSIFSWIFE